MSQIPPGPIAILPILDGNSGGGVSKKAFNLVTFTPDDAAGTLIYLKLDGAWTMHVGVKPDINKAVISYVEMDKFGNPPNCDRTGKIDFWYSKTAAAGGDGDVTLKGVRVIAVEGLEQREIPADPPDNVVTAEYRLFFSDFRDQFVEPRGGRLEEGLLNEGLKSPSNQPGQPPAVSTAPEVSLNYLITACLKKMGMGEASIPDLGNTDAPRDVKWFGNHAPSELEKLLGICGVAFIPGLDGTGSLAKITNEGTPTLPAGDALPVQSIPTVDRRGKVVVFSSYPRRVITTQTESGPASDSWYFVMQDSQDVWQPIEKCDLIGKAGGVGAFINDFHGTLNKEVEPKFQLQVEQQFFRCIQASQSPLPAAIAPVLTRRFEKDLQDYPIEVLSAVAAADRRGMYRNTRVPIPINVLHKLDEDILILDRPLLTVKIATQYPTEYIKGSANFTVRYSHESAQLDSESGNYVPTYFHVGFSAGAAGGAPTKLSEDDCENAIDGNTKDAIILTRSQWRLIKVDGAEVNRADLEGKAAAEAANYLKDASQPARICAARGFASISPSGLVTEVQWDQANLKTTAKLADWFVPNGALQEQHALRKLERDGEAYPNQGASESSMTAYGESGAQQPVLPIAVASSAVSPPSFRLVNMSSGFAGGGFYTVVNAYGSAQQFGVDATAKKDLKMPEGLKTASADTNAIGVNFAEHGQFSHNLPLGSFQIAFPIGQYIQAPGANPIDVLALLTTKEVTIQIIDTPGNLPSLGGGGNGEGEYAGYVVDGAPGGNFNGKAPKPVDVTKDLAMPVPGQSIAAKPKKVYFQNLWENNHKNGTRALAVDGTEFVRGSFEGFASDGIPIYHGRAAPARSAIIVDLTTDGGTTPLFTYTAKLRGSSILILGTNLTPLFRDSWKNLTAATTGIGDWGADGNFELVFAYEKITTSKQCVSS